MVLYALYRIARQVRAPAPGTSESPNWEAFLVQNSSGEIFVSSKMGRVTLPETNIAPKNDGFQ